MLKDIETLIGRKIRGCTLKELETIDNKLKNKVLMVSMIKNKKMFNNNWSYTKEDYMAVTNRTFHCCFLLNATNLLSIGKLLIKNKVEPLPPLNQVKGKPIKKKPLKPNIDSMIENLFLLYGIKIPKTIAKQII
jgi:hypothetical protein